MQEIARHIAKVSKESELPVVEDECVSSFKVELMDAVVQWWCSEFRWEMSEYVECRFGIFFEEDLKADIAWHAT